jgi:hypothetical protein
MIFTEQHMVAPAIYPDADLYAGGATSDVFNMKLYDHITFILTEGVGASGTATVTVEECTSAAGAGNTAIAFNYRVASTPDTWGAVTAATTSGFTTTKGGNRQYVIEVDAAELSAGSPYIRAVCTEVSNFPQDAGMVAVLSKARYPQDVLSTSLV